MTSDGELLRRYAETDSEDAFAELVRRHVNLVYSAALRQLNGDAHLAQDVAQSVFTDLARKAAALSKRETLTGWLYSGTHFAAAKAVRGEQRRHHREQEAHAMQELLAPLPDLNWEKLRPVLDQVMHELNETDRTTILMRYFENQSFADIGQKLGLTEDAARKRTDRALEKLRGFLSRHGLGAAAALGTVLSANAVQVAPAGLAATLASGSLTAVTAGTAATFSFLKIVTLSKLQAGVIGTIAAACIIAPLALEHQAQAALRQKDETWLQHSNQIATLSADNERLSSFLAKAGQNAKLANGHNDELLRLRGEIAPLQEQLRELTQTSNRKPASAPMSLAEREKFWLDRMAQLKAWADENPGEKIPEMKYLTDSTWINSIGSITFEHQEDYERAMGTVRANAEGYILDRLQTAMRAYMKTNNNEFPTDLSEVIPYLSEPIDDNILTRYEIVPSSGMVTNFQGVAEWVITTKAPVNAQYDVRDVLGLTGGRLADERVTNRWNFIQNP